MGAELKEKSKKAQIHQEREVKCATKNIPSGKEMGKMMDPEDLKYLITTETDREEKEEQKRKEVKKQLKKELKEVDKLAKGDSENKKKLKNQEIRLKQKKVRKSKKRKLDLNNGDVEENYEQQLTDI